MKKALVFVCVLTLMLGTAGVIIAGMTSPGVRETPHDVQVMTGEAGLEPCAMCHSPHSGTGQYPLWNRDQAAQSYTPYESPTFDMIDAGGGKQPQEPSNLCLVCHNGVFSSLINYPGPGSHANENYDYEMNPTFWAMLGTNLMNDHPISFTYQGGAGNPDEIQDRNGFPITVNCDAGSNRTFIEPTACANALGFGPGFPLYGSDRSQFECTTCHSVHDTVDYPGKQIVGGKSVGNQVFFLRCDNTGSQMCGDCHKRRLDGVGLGAGW